MVQKTHTQQNDTAHLSVDKLSAEQAEKELLVLAKQLSAANTAYHRDDTPDISDAEYDQLKRRNLAIENAFPALKRADSPSDQVGGEVADGFGKIQHVIRMLSLGNAFTDEDVDDFDGRIRKYLGLGSDAHSYIRQSPKSTGCHCLYDMNMGV